MKTALSLNWLLRRFRLFGGVCAIVFSTAFAAQSGPDLRLLRSVTTPQLPIVQPAWTRPDDPGQVFFIQRSMNPNTVVYTARFDKDGALARTSPMAAYWRRYAEHGQKRKLKLVERLFAYGISTRKAKTAAHWTAHFAALPDLSPELRQDGPFRAALWAEIKDRPYRLIYGYLDLDETGLIPKVVRLRLFTFDPQKDAYVTHMISVSGGDILQ